MIPRKSFLFSAFSLPLLMAARRWPRRNTDTIRYLTNFDQAIQWLSDSGVVIQGSKYDELKSTFQRWADQAPVDSEFAAVFLTALAECYGIA